MPRKRPSGLPKRPRAVKKDPSVASEPSKPPEAPPVTPLPFDAAWGLLIPRQREYVRGMAEERGVTLPGLYAKFPHLWPR